MKLKKLGALLLSASLMMAALTACGSKPAANDAAEDTKGADSAATDTAADDEENYETGDAPPRSRSRNPTPATPPRTIP